MPRFPLSFQKLRDIFITRTTHIARDHECQENKKHTSISDLRPSILNTYSYSIVLVDDLGKGDYHCMPNMTSPLMIDDEGKIDLIS